MKLQDRLRRFLPTATCSVEYKMGIGHTLKIAIIILTYYYWNFDISKRLIESGIFLVADIGVNGES